MYLKLPIYRVWTKLQKTWLDLRNKCLGTTLRSGPMSMCHGVMLTHWRGHRDSHHTSFFANLRTMVRLLSRLHRLTCATSANHIPPHSHIPPALASTAHHPPRHTLITHLWWLAISDPFQYLQYAPYCGKLLLLYIYKVLTLICSRLGVIYYIKSMS